MSKIRTKMLTFVVAIALMFASIACITFSATLAHGEGAKWTGVNSATTTIDGNKISSGTAVETNDFVAKYSETINLKEGFKLDFTIDSFNGAGSSAWDQATTTDNICFALTGEQASSTEQNAYVFGFTKHSTENTVLLFTAYTKNFKIDNGIVSYSKTAFDNTTGNGTFDVTMPWVDGMQMSLAANVINGIPMFWTNGAAVNPMGADAWWFTTQDGGSKSFTESLTSFYKDFVVKDSAMNLYAFNSSAASQDGKFAITVDSIVKPYSAVNNGWLATDMATADTAGDGVVFSKIKNSLQNGLSRTRFIYNEIVDLDDQSIEFSYSTNKEFVNDSYTLLSIRGVGMDQFTSIKSVTTANYEEYLFSGGATIGVFDNAEKNNAQGFGLSSTQKLPITAAEVGGKWATYNIVFEKKTDDVYRYTVNGTEVAEYTRAQLISVLGEDLKAEILISPNAKAGEQLAEYKLSNVSFNSPVKYVKGTIAPQAVTFNVMLPSGSTFVKMSEDGNDLAIANYTFEESVLTFETTFLENLSVGAHTFVMSLSDNKQLYFKINVSQFVKIEVNEADTIANVKGFAKDLSFKTIAGEGDELVSVTFNNKPLSFSEDGQVIITRSELNKLHFGVYPVVIKSNNGTNSFNVTVNKVATSAPIWADGQSDIINDVNVVSAEPIVLKVDVKDAADCYILLDGKELSATEAVFDSNAKTVTLVSDIIKKLSLGEHYVVVHTDGGVTPAIKFKAVCSLDDWNVGNSVTAPVKNDKGEIVMTGSTILEYKNNIDLSEGFTFNFVFGEVFDMWEITESMVEFEIRIEQDNAKYIIYFRTYADGTPDYTYQTVQFIQQLSYNGTLADNSLLFGSVAFDQSQTWSIKLLNSTILTMFNHHESRTNGMPISNIGEQKFDNAKLTVLYNTSSSKEHKHDSVGKLVSFGAFDEETKKLPTWAKEYFLPPLDAPTVRVEGNTVVWDAQEGATQYIIYVNGEPQDYVDNGTEFDVSIYGAVGDKLDVQIKAIGDKMTVGDSALSEVIEVTIVKESPPKPDDNKESGCGKNSATAAVLASVLMIGLMFVIKKR